MIDPALPPGMMRGHASGPARILVFSIGLALCSWGILKARNRTVLIPTITLVLAIGAGVMAFAVDPGAFDALSFLVGISYPPVFYLLLAVTAVIIVILHLAMRLSVTDERCRKLSQEIALLRAEQEAQSRNSREPGGAR
jgi:hypothetical protein